MSTNAKETSVSNEALAEILKRCHRGQSEQQIVTEMTATTGATPADVQTAVEECKEALVHINDGIAEGLEAGVRKSVRSSLERSFERYREKAEIENRERRRIVMRVLAWMLAVPSGLLTLIQLLALARIVAEGSLDNETLMAWTAFLVVITLPICTLTVWLFRRSRRPDESPQAPQPS